MIRATLPLAVLLALAGCGGGEDKDDAMNQAQANELAAAQRIPPPKTPVLNVSGEMQNEVQWIEPQAAPGDPTSAPYGNVLDAPLVNAQSR